MQGKPSQGAKTLRRIGVSAWPETRHGSRQASESERPGHASASLVDAFVSRVSLDRVAPTPPLHPDRMRGGCNNYTLLRGTPHLTAEYEPSTGRIAVIQKPPLRNTHNDV